MDPGVPHQSPPRPEPRPRSLIGLPRVLGIGGSALILVLLMGSTLAASGSGVHAVASAPRPFTGVLSAPQPVTSRLGGPVSPMSGIRAALGPDAPTGVSSTVLLGSGSLYSVLPGNQNPINLLNLESLTTIPGSPDILGTALTGDQGPNGTVFTFNASSNVVDQAVGSPFPNPLASA
ncbi:MAG: hypothetical protein L3K08_05430, partial [Thermoplasmata archaeon]|nr:hypothetical protein [Thermoplasmata archaeon]